jgi:hypothetical protein
VRGITFRSIKDVTVRSILTMAGSSSDVWRNRVAGLALVAFGFWNVVSGELLPFPTRQRVEGLGARVIGGLILLIGVVVLVQTIARRKADEEQEDE